MIPHHGGRSEDAIWKMLDKNPDRALPESAPGVSLTDYRTAFLCFRDKI